VSTTTVGDLLERAERLARVLRIDGADVTADQWRALDATVYRLLAELIGQERTGTRVQIAGRASVTRIVNGYPSPLATPGSETTYNARQAASHLGVSYGTIVSDIRRSRLPATYDGRTYSIKATDLSCAPDVQPADPASTHTLDRLSATLGALADMVVAERARTTTIPGFDPLRDDAQVTPVMARVLAMTLVAARHTLVNIPLREADRPLAIARYAEHALDTLGDVNRPSALNQVASFAPPSSPRGPNEQLEAALRGWAAHARSELARTVPSSKVLRDIANQARHLYAVSTHLVAASFASGHLSEHEAEMVHVELRDAAQVMHRLQQEWEPVTTATRPTHEYVTATTALHASLSSLEPQSLPPGGQVDAAKRIDIDLALADLRYAATDLVELTNTAALLPEPLIRSGLLFAPARILPSTMERVHDRNHGRYVAIQLSEGAELIDAAKTGASAARQAQTTLEITAQPAATTELQALPPAAGQLTRRALEPATSLGGLDV
jgi:excisionase family DNA binding protein